MSWAIGIWAGYAFLTLLVFIAAWLGLNYVQKALLSDSSDEKE